MDLSELKRLETQGEVERRRRAILALAAAIDAKGDYEQHRGFLYDGANIKFGIRSFATGELVCRHKVCAIGKALMVSGLYPDAYNMGGLLRSVGADVLANIMRWNDHERLSFHAIATRLRQMAA